MYLLYLLTKLSTLAKSEITVMQNLFPLIFPIPAFTFGNPFDSLVKPFGAGFGCLGISNPKNIFLPVRWRKCFKIFPGILIFIQCFLQIIRHFQFLFICGFRLGLRLYSIFIYFYCLFNKIRKNFIRRQIFQAGDWK